MTKVKRECLISKRRDADGVTLHQMSVSRGEKYMEMKENVSGNMDCSSRLFGWNVFSEILQ